MNVLGRRNWTTLALLTAVTLSAVAAHADIVFDPATDIGAGTRPDTVAAADLDGVNGPDMAISSDDPDKVSIFFNNGDGTFAPAVDVLTGAGTGPGHVLAVDVDGDEDLDLVVALHNVNAVLVIENLGGGVFVAGDTFGVGTDPRNIAAADFDGQNGIDLATSNRDSNDVSILLNDGTGSFGPATNVAVELDPREVTAGDFDGDEAVDLAVTNHDSRSISILTNDGFGGFFVSDTLSVGAQLRPDGITNDDYDGDLDRDLAVTTSGNGMNFVSVFLNDGAGAFTGPFNNGVGGQNPGSIVGVDMDCDGDLDLAVANEDSNDVSLMDNAGDATFVAKSFVDVGLHPDYVAAADFDGNGAIDVVTANRDSNDISVAMNQSPTCPAELITVLPDVFRAVRGLRTSGTVEDLFDSDDSYLVVQTSAFAPAPGPQVILEVEGTSPFGLQPPSELRFTFEGHIVPTSPSPVQQQTFLFNYNTQEFDLLDTRSAARDVDEAFDIVIEVNPERYIEPETGVVAARMEFATLGLSGFLHFDHFDQTIWTMAP